MLGWGKKSYLGPVEIALFSSWGFSRSNKHNTTAMLYRLDISTFYFYEPLLLKSFVSSKFIKS